VLKGDDFGTLDFNLVDQGLGIALAVALGLGFLLDQELRLAWLQLPQLLLLLLQFLLPLLKTGVEHARVHLGAGRITGQRTTSHNQSKGTNNLKRSFI
jgi:hypothetical protein